MQARLARSTTYKPTVTIAGQYLGLSATALRAKLHGGKTLSQLADGTPGKSTKGLVAAVMAVRINELVHGVDETSEATLRHESALLQGLEARVRTEVQRAAPAVTVAPAADFGRRRVTLGSCSRHLLEPTDDHVHASRHDHRVGAARAGRGLRGLPA